VSEDNLNDRVRDEVERQEDKGTLIIFDTRVLDRDCLAQGLRGKQMDTRNNCMISAVATAAAAPDARFLASLIGSRPFRLASAVFRRTHPVAMRRSWKIKRSML